LAALVLLVVGCTSGEPARMSPTASIQEFRIEVSPSAVYERIYTRMDQCHAVHNIFFPGDIVGGMARDGKRGRIFFATNGLALWGADIEAADAGSRVITRIGQNAGSERYHALIRGWVEAKRRQQPGETDC
jgi:hypothetical protein